MRITVKHLTADYLREILRYDPLTGIFTWKVDRGGQKVGDVAGCVNGRGYVLIKIDGVKYTAGRLAYLYMQGEPVEPHIEIDHHNQIKSDNRWENLSPVTHAENIAKYHGIVPRSRNRSRRQSTTPLSDDPLRNMRQFLADNAASRELAELTLELERRKGIKRSPIQDGRSIRAKVKPWEGYIDFAIEDRIARKKAKAD